MRTPRPGTRCVWRPWCRTHPGRCRGVRRARRHSRFGSAAWRRTVTTCTRSEGSPPAHRPSTSAGSRVPQDHCSEASSINAANCSMVCDRPSLSDSCQAAGNCSVNARAVNTTCTSAGCNASRARTACAREACENHSFVITTVPGHSLVCASSFCQVATARRSCAVKGATDLTAVAARLWSNRRSPGTSRPSCGEPLSVSPQCRLQKRRTRLRGTDVQKHPISHAHCLPFVASRPHARRANSRPN